MLARSKGNVGKIKGDVPVPNIPNIPKFGYKLIELLTHLQVWDSLMLAPNNSSIHCRLVRYRYDYVGKVSLQTLTKISRHIDNQDIATKLSVLTYLVVPSTR